MEYGKEELVALVSTTRPSITMAAKLTLNGLMRFSGNQWHEDWEWVLEKLEVLPVEELERMYYAFRKVIV